MKTPAFYFVFLALIGFILSPLAVAHESSSLADSMPFCAFDDYEQWRRDHPRPAPFTTTTWVHSPKERRL